MVRPRSPFTPQTVFAALVLLTLLVVGGFFVYAVTES